MADMTLDDYKRLALEQAALQPPPVASPQMSGAMPNLSAPPQVSPAAPQMMPGPVPNVPTQIPTVTPVQAQPGPIKSFLTQFAHGAGQGLLAHVGLETDPQRQQRLFTQQQAIGAAQRASTLNAAQADYYSGRNEALQQQNAPVDTSTLNIPGLSGIVLQKDLPKVLVEHIKGGNALATQGAKNQGNIDVTKLKYGDGSQPGPLNTVIKDIGGRTFLLRKGTGEKLQDLGQANSIATANARAEAAARYGLVDTMDDNGNPVGVSRLSALQSGSPSVSFDALKQINSDRVGISQYADILDNKISPNLKVLNDPTQRAIIAHTLAEAEKNPGAIQALLTSGAQSGLSPQGAALAAGIMQGREFGGVARKYGGNMNGTEGLMNRIMSNQASPLNTEQLNRDLIQNDRDFTTKAMGALGGQTSHRANGTAAVPQVAPTTAPSGGNFFQQFGGSPHAP